ncbi:MAG: hypothetical protein ACE366_10610 [Bradymonadia bacterium]
MSIVLPLLVALLAPDAGGTPTATGQPATVQPATGQPAAAEPAPPPPAKGPPPEATLECGPNPVKMGEPLVCTLTAVAPDGVRVEVPVPASVGLSTVKSIDAPGASKAGAASGAGTKVLPDGKRQWVRRFSITSLTPRDVKVPTLTLTWHEPDGAVGHVDVAGMVVPITLTTAGQLDTRFRTLSEPLGRAPQQSVAEGEEKPALSEADQAAVSAFWSAHGPTPYLITNWPLIIALIVFGAGGIGFAIAWAVRRWLDQREVEEAPWVDPRPAHVIALAALVELEEQGLPAEGLIKQYYSRLSEIIRDYFERRFGFYALEMTTDEIRSKLPELSLSVEGHQAVEDFLAESDLVKFAGFAPSESAIDTVMRAARGIVELTRVPDTPVAPSEAPVVEPPSAKTHLIVASPEEPSEAEEEAST